MFSTKEIWEAGRKALGLPPIAPSAASPAPVFVVEVPDPAPSDVFDPSAFPFEPRAYRIHFKNGHSGEYDGAALATGFPFDATQVERIEPVEEVGQGA